MDGIDADSSRIYETNYPSPGKLTEGSIPESPSKSRGMFTSAFSLYIVRWSQKARTWAAASSSLTVKGT